MKTVTVSGSSDDIISIDGAINEEFGAFEAPKQYLEFNEGTVLSIEYGSEGCWAVAREREGSAAYTHAPRDNDETTYTDKATLVGDLTSVKLRKRMPRVRVTGTLEKDAAKWRYLVDSASEAHVDGDDIHITITNRAARSQAANELHNAIEGES